MIRHVVGIAEVGVEEAAERMMVEYRRKREFRMIAEPMGGEAPQHSKIFVVQRHHASRLHFDLRLAFALSTF